MTNEPASAPAKTPIIPVLALIAALVGGVLMVVGFLGVIDAALNGSGNGAALYTILFALGGLLVLAGLITGIVCLIRGKHRVLAVVTIVLALLPLIGMIVLWLAQAGAS